MRTLTRDTALVSAMILAAGVQTCLAQSSPAHEQCWVDYKAKIKTCCKLSTTADRDTCFRAAESEMEACLLQFPTPTSVDCWTNFLGHIGDCGSGPCGTSSEAACDDAAYHMHRWCLGLSWDSIFTPPALRLDSNSSTLMLRETYTATIEVHDPNVTGVTVFLAHDDAATGARQVVEIGMATAQANGLGDARIWTMDIDLHALPVVDDQRISLIARTEIEDRSGAIDLVSFEITPFDFNGDGQWDLFDHLEFNNAWQQGDARADLSRDGTIDLLDVSEFQALSQ